jgi:RNA polymerase sigma-70 factor, ECF subfamily
VDSDSILVARAASGNRDAFDELVRRYRRQVHGLVRVLTGGDNEAEDLVQDIFVRAYRAIGSFRGESAFRSWLYRIAINAVHTHNGKRRVRESAFAFHAHDERSMDDLPSGANLEEAMLHRQTIERALADLPEALRVLIVLRDVQGLKYDEIARILKMPRGTVESRLFRARQKLRQMHGKKGPVPEV